MLGSTYSRQQTNCAIDAVAFALQLCKNSYKIQCSSPLMADLFQAHLLCGPMFQNRA